MLPHNHFIISGLAAVPAAVLLSPEKPVVEWALISGFLSAAVDYDVYILVLLKSVKENKLKPFRNPLEIFRKYKLFMDTIAETGVLKIGLKTHLIIPAIIVLLSYFFAYPCCCRSCNAHSKRYTKFVEVCKEMRRAFVFLIIFLVLLAYVASSSIADELLLKVFQINYRKAEEMEKAVEMLLSPEGKISIDKRTNSLIVKDYPANIRAVADFLKEQDRKIQQVKIKIRYIDEAALKRIGASIGWQYRGGQWAVGNIMSNKKGMNIDALLGAEKERQKITGEQTLIVMSGSEGRIAVGRSIPYTDWFYWYTKNRGYMIKETKFKDVSTGFVVRPRVAGSNINIDISPQISYFSDGRMNEIIYREASTTIICKNGETVLIGSSDTSSENIIGNIFGGLQASKTEGSFYIMLTPEILK